MPTLHRLTVASSVIALAFIVGCGNREADGLARLKNAAATKDAKTATIEIKSFLQKHPKSAPGRYLLGQQLVSSGEFTAAVSEFQRALDGGHPPHEVIPAMARAMLKSGDLSKLLSLYKDQKLEQPEAMANLSATVATAMALQGDTAGATALIDRVLAGAPKTASARLLKARLLAGANRMTEGVQVLDALLADHPGDGEAWSAKGEFMLRVPGGQQAAADAFAKALAANPDDAFALGATVSLQLALGQLEAAKKALAQLKKLAPKKFGTMRSEGIVAYATGDYARAREIYQALLKAAPTNMQVLLLAGENELRLDSPTQAEAMLAKASALEPRNALARRLLAESQLRLDQPAKALVTLAPILEAADAPADVLGLAARARLANGESKAANALFDRLARMKPTDARLRTMVATAGLGKADDAQVLAQLRDIAAEDVQGTSADMALIGAQLKRGLLDETLPAVDALARKRPNDPLSHQLRGQILTQKGDLVAARKAFEQALKINRDYFHAIGALAALDLRANQPDAARQRLTDLLKRQPKSAQALLALAEIAGRQPGGRDAALKHIQAAVKAMPGSADAHVALIANHFAGNRFDAALNAALAANAALPENIELLHLLARCQMRLKQPAQALASYSKLIQLRPKIAAGHVGQADVHLSSNDLVLAQRSVDTALALEPGSPEAQGQAVTLALLRNQHDAALVIARDMQARRPTDTRGWLVEGEIESRRDRWDAAATVFRKLLDRPGADVAAMKLHHALLRAKKPQEADQVAQRWLAAHSKDAGFLFYLGASTQARGDLVAAEQRYRDALAVDAAHTDALNNLAMLLLQQKKPGALALAERAVKGAPDQPALLDTLAQAQATEGQAARAVETQARAVALAPAESSFKLSLARHLIAAGEKAKAKRELDALAKLGSGFAQQAEVTQLRDGLGPVLPGR